LYVCIKKKDKQRARGGFISSIGCVLPKINKYEDPGTPTQHTDR